MSKWVRECLSQWICDWLREWISEWLRQGNVRWKSWMEVDNKPLMNFLPTANYSAANPRLILSHTGNDCGNQLSVYDRANATVRFLFTCFIVCNRDDVNGNFSTLLANAQSLQEQDSSYTTVAHERISKSGHFSSKWFCVHKHINQVIFTLNRLLRRRRSML